MRNTVGTEFAIFWDTVEGSPLWVSYYKTGLSPTGIPDDARHPPKSKTLLDIMIEKPQPSLATKEYWKFTLGSAGVLASVFVLLAISTIWDSVPYPIRYLITIYATALPLGILSNNQDIIHIAILGFATIVATLLFKARGRM
jgi:hypothetical protein